VAKGASRLTLVEVTNARHTHPFSLGPLLGALALHANLTVGTVAKLLHVPDAAASSWFVGTKEVPLEYILRVSKLIGILAWLYGSRKAPLSTSQDTRRKQLEEYIRNFRLMATAD
jgi:plasmid maintenance system antidote protein VapI